MTSRTISARVKYAALPPKDFGHGPRINIKAVLEDSTALTVWGKPSDPIKDLQKSQSIQLTYNGRSYKLAQPAQEQPTAQLNADTFTSRLGQAITGYELSWKAAIALLNRQNISPDTALIQAIASELFQAART